jgi:hypothetical protein
MELEALTERLTAFCRDCSRRMDLTIPPGQDPACTFLDEVATWLALTNDPRLLQRGSGGTAVRDAGNVCGDFCKFLVEVTEGGLAARDWRVHLARSRKVQ